MIKTIHVHTDLKFFVGTNRFSELDFDNTIIIIGPPTTFVSLHRDQAVFLSNSLRDLNRIVEICSDADLVVLYGLDVVKSYLATRLPQNVVVAWRFFGGELYWKNVADYLSERSLRLYRTYNIPRQLKRLFSQLKPSIMYGSSSNALFADAVKRIDLFLGLSEYEYDHLASHWHNLPRFVQLPMLDTATISGNIRNNIYNKDDLVIIGNSANIWNNHLDIIDLINNSNVDDKLSFLIPFSYGSGREYLNEVRRQIKKTPKNIRLLEDFMPRDTYFEFITTAKAAVINSYRQMAMGNIFVLLAQGVKIYLNPRNVIYHWLVDHAMSVYTIEDFASDLACATSLELTSEKKRLNVAAIQQLECKFNVEEFTTHILAAMKDSNGSLEKAKGRSLHTQGYDV